jgi:CCR4-NOT transcriptional complex subunit CAF120
VNRDLLPCGERLTCADGRASGDRQWVECYAQLVGTVLSLWDSAALDAAGGEEVPATFINLADASLKMVRFEPFLGSRT